MPNCAMAIRRVTRIAATRVNSTSAWPSCRFRIFNRISRPPHGFPRSASVAALRLGIPHQEGVRGTEAPASAQKRRGPGRARPGPSTKRTYENELRAERLGHVAEGRADAAGEQLEGGHDDHRDDGQHDGVLRHGLPALLLQVTA